MGNFCILAVFERYFSNAWTHPHQILFVCPLPLWGPSAPEGRGWGVKNSKKWGMVSFVLRTATISIFLSVARCGSICRAQTCAQSDVEPSRSAKAFLQGGPKTWKKNSNFSPFRDFTSLYLRKLLKIEAHKQRTEKTLSLPYPTVAWGSTG